MSLTEKINTTFEALLEDAAPNLVTTATVLDTPVPSTVVGPLTAVEGPLGQYTVNITIALPGTYLIQWSQPDEVVATEIVEVLGQEESLTSWRPSTRAVALRAQSTTAAGGGNMNVPIGSKSGDFNNVTSPTADTVEGMISTAMDDVRMVVGDIDSVPEIWRDARTVCSIRAALIVVTSKASESQVDMTAVIRFLTDDYKVAIAQLVESFGDVRGGGESGAGDDRTDYTGGHTFIPNDLPSPYGEDGWSSTSKPVIFNTETGTYEYGDPFGSY